MSAPAVRPATLLVIVLIGALLSVGWASAGTPLGWFPLDAAITGLGVLFVALAVVEIMLLRRLDGLRADLHAETSISRSLTMVIGIGALIAVFFAATGTQLGIVPIASAVTALGITAAVLTITLVALLFNLRPAEEPVMDGVMLARPMVHVEPVEEADHVMRIEGIGARYATRLNAYGIITVPQLLRADAETVAPQIGATTELVEQWQAMAELLAVKGVGPQTAEVLVHIGITSIGALADAEPQDIVDRVAAAEAKRKVRIQGSDVKLGTATRWVAAAQEHRREMLGTV